MCKEERKEGRDERFRGEVRGEKEGRGARGRRDRWLSGWGQLRAPGTWFSEFTGGILLGVLVKGRTNGLSL